MYGGGVKEKINENSAFDPKVLMQHQKCFHNITKGFTEVL